MARGIRLRYVGNDQPINDGVRIHLVPIFDKPLFVHHKPVAGDSCPTCGVLHMVKTVHLWLDQNNTCLVSEGVLAQLREAGPEDADGLRWSELEVAGDTDNPPPLNVGEGKSRRQVDQENETITIGAANG